MRVRHCFTELEAFVQPIGFGDDLLGDAAVSDEVYVRLDISLPLCEIFHYNNNRINHRATYKV